ncbi:unnamed protein product [Discosporangium mesarthrocarpum]
MNIYLCTRKNVFFRPQLSVNHKLTRWTKHKAMLAKGYLVVPQRHRGSGLCYRHLFLKEHGGAYKIREGGGKGDAGAENLSRTFAKGNTLFVGNVDDQGGRLCREAIEERLRRMFAQCGRIEHVNVGRPPATVLEESGSAGSKGGDEAGRVRVAHVR